MFSFSGKKNKIEIPRNFSPLENGDILIDCNISYSNAFHETKKDDDLFSLLSERCLHAMLYADKKVYHAVLGQVEKVASHDLVKATHLLSDHSYYQLSEKHIVLDCKNQKLKKYMIEAAKTWTIDVVATPFTLFDARPEDKKFTQEYHLYRAFRAAYRNQQKLPLSKKKGVSCANFLSYVIRTAIIQFLFSKEMPKKIQDKILEIEKLKKTKYAKTLQELDEQVFVDFNRLVDDEVKKARPVDMKDDMKQDCLEFLKMEMKGKSVHYFCKSLKNFPNLFQFAGYLFFLEKKDNGQTSYEPYVMNHETYVNWYKQLNVTMPSRILNQCDVEVIQHLAEPVELNTNKRRKLM